MSVNQTQWRGIAAEFVRIIRGDALLEMDPDLLAATEMAEMCLAALSLKPGGLSD